MKILTIVFDLEKGGTQRAAQVFAEGYLALGNDSKVLAMYDLGSRYEEIKSQMHVWHGISQDTIKAISIWQPEIIHLHSLLLKLSDVNRIISSCPNAKIIETNVFTKVSPWISKVDVSFQLSYWAEWLFNLRGGKKYTSAVLPNPIKCDAFNRASDEKIKEFKQTYGIPQNAFVIGRIGQADIGSWSTYIVNVFDQLIKTYPKAYLLLVNPPLEIVEKGKQSRNKSQIICIPKIIGDKKLSIAYSSMDIMLHILPKGETFGIVIAESILCETPVITLSTPWFNNSQVEVVKNGIGGYVVNNKKNLIKVINKLKSGELKFDPIKAKKHIINSFDYLKVSNDAISITMGKKNTIKPSTLKIISILNKSQDKPRTITTILLKTNKTFLRHFTVFTAGYKGGLDIIIAIFNFIRRKI